MAFNLATAEHAVQPYHWATLGIKCAQRMHALRDAAESDHLDQRLVRARKAPAGMQQHPQGTRTVSNLTQASSRRAGMLLGLSNVLDMLGQFAVPILLSRLFATGDFGAYRSLWLLAGTAVAVAPWGIPASLYYFLPRSSGRVRAAHIRNAIVAMACISGLLLCMTSLLTAGGAIDFHDPILFSVFASLWVFSALLDTLCSAVGKIEAQAKINLTFALLRVGLIAGTAVATKSIEYVIYAHVVLAATRAIATLWLVGRMTRTEDDQAQNDNKEAPRLRDLISYTLPFGASAALYGLRSKADQWIVIANFGQAAYGVYSLGSFFAPIQGVIRSTANAIALPAINRLHANSGHASASELNKTTNIAVAAIMFPTLAFLLANAEAIVGIIFGQKYVQAAAVVQIFTCTLIVECVEVTTLLIANRQGRFLMKVDAVSLVIAVACGYLGLLAFGTTGAAIGALAASSCAQAALFIRLRGISGQRLSQLQEWRHLGNIALASSVAAAAAFVAKPLAGQPALCLLLAAAIHSVVYVASIRATKTRAVFRAILGERISKYIFI